MTHDRSKTLATWLALVGGSLGLHRFYLHGTKDVWAWLHPIPTLVGLYGVQRVQQLGQDDPLSWLLIPLLGLMVAQAALFAIIYGLTSDERWATHFNAGHAVRPTRRAASVRWGVAGNIVWAWIFTIPASAFIAAVFYWVSLRLF